MQNKEKFIYLCYCKEDYRTVTSIKKALKEKGLEIRHSSKSQDNATWAQEAQTLIENCEIFMPVVTENFIENERCRKEVVLADSINKNTVTLFMKKTPLKYGMALQLSAEQGIERWMHETFGSFISSLLRSPVIQNLLNSTAEYVTKSAFASYLLFAIKQGEISVNALIDRFSITLEKATNVFSHMLSYGFIANPNEDGISKTLLSEFGFEILYFKTKKAILLSQLSKDTPYAFVSYAHKNSDEVIPLINNLQKERVRVWFDEGIEVGAEWPATIQQRIIECELFIPVITPEFVESKNCRKEVYLADKHAKKTLPLILQECELKYGLDLQFVESTPVKKSDFPNDFSFDYTLASHPLLEKIKADSEQFVDYDCFIDCIKLLIENKNASISFFQRKLNIGFRRAFLFFNALIESALAYSDSNEEKFIIYPNVTLEGLTAFTAYNDTDILF